MKSKMLGLVVAGCLAVSLCGCAQGGGDAQDNGVASEPAASTVEEGAGEQPSSESDGDDVEALKDEMTAMLEALETTNVTVDTEIDIEAGAGGVDGGQSSNILVKVALDAEDPRAYYAYDMPGSDLDGVEMYVTKSQIVVVAEGVAVDAEASQAEIDEMLESHSDLSTALVPIENATDIKKTSEGDLVKYHVVADAAAVSTSAPTEGFDRYTAYEADYTFDAEGHLLEVTGTAAGVADHNGTEINLTMTSVASYSDYGTTVVPDAPEPVQL